MPQTEKSPQSPPPPSQTGKDSPKGDHGFLIHGDDGKFYMIPAGKMHEFQLDESRDLEPKAYERLRGEFVDRGVVAALIPPHDSIALVVTCFFVNAASIQEPPPKPGPGPKPDPPTS